MKRKVYDGLAKVGTYQDGEGNTKNRYQKVGVVIENEEGNLSFKLESIPVAGSWNGWINFFRPQNTEGSNSN